MDVLRGLSLMMIFVDHIPSDWLNLATMHNFGYADAAEVFVLLAGFSSMAAYGRAFSEHGSMEGIRRIAIRCLKIYAAQMLLLLLTLAVVRLWTDHFDIPALSIAPILHGGARPLRQAVTLRALPTYLDILPMYIVLLAMFPLLYVAMRRHLWLTLAGSAAVWAIVFVHPEIDLPNLIDPDGKGWYFDPFSWQFLFTIGMALAVALRRYDGMLPRHRPITIACIVILLAAFIQAGSWKNWGLPDLRLLALPPPDKSHLSPVRLIDMLALSYLVLGSPALYRLAQHRWLRPLEACGKHSLEVFALCSIMAMFGRLSFRTFGTGLAMQIAINGVGGAVIIGAALLMEHRRRIARPTPPTLAPVSP